MTARGAAGGSLGNGLQAVHAESAGNGASHHVTAVRAVSSWAATRAAEKVVGNHSKYLPLYAYYKPCVGLS